MTDSKPVRWWPAIAIVALAAIAWGAVWFRDFDSHQDRIMMMILVGVLTTFLLVLWLVFLSRIPWKHRFMWLAILLLAAFGATRLVRVRGVSGDVLPLLEWSWSAGGDLPEVSVLGNVVPVEAGPDDYPQFLGPERTGVLAARRFGTDWETVQPRLVWKQAIGEGWSAFAVVGNRAVTQEQRDDLEWVSCYDVDSGALLWKSAPVAGFSDPLGGPGPRATPTIAGDIVYAQGGDGPLRAMRVADGTQVWAVDISRDSGADPPTYGFAGSPLVVGDVVVAVPGGREGRALIAYDRLSGSQAWSGGSRKAGYSSPVAMEFAGIPQIVLFDGEGLTGHSPEDGAELWHAKWHGSTEHVSNPVQVADDLVYQSSGYGVGGKLFRVLQDENGGWSVEDVWESRSLKAKFTNVVLRDGYLYGLDDGILACVDVTSGERVWKGGRYGHGQIILADDVLVVQSEKGFVAIVAATPDGYTEKGRFEALDGKTWNHAALSGRRLLVRNDREAARFDLPGN